MTDDHPAGFSYRRKVERWMEVLSSAWSHRYYGWFPGPYTMFHKLESEDDYHARLGFTGDVAEYMDRNVGTDVHMWLSWHLGWNRSRPLDDLLAVFYSSYFGRAAGEMRAVYERFEAHMRTAATEGRHGGDVSIVRGLYPPELIDEALARIAVAKTQVSDDSLRLARVARDETCLLSTRLFVRSYGAARAYYEDRSEAARVRANEAADAFADFHDRRAIPFPRSARSLLERFTFSRAGRFAIADHFDRSSGRSWRARSCVGFVPGEWGLDLPPRATGEIVYEFSTASGFRFGDATCQLLHRGPVTIEVSADGGATWSYVPPDDNDAASARENDITRFVAGRARFWIRFGARNETGERVLALDLMEVSGHVESGAQKP